MSHWSKWMVDVSLDYENLRGPPPQCHLKRQEIAGLIKGLLTSMMLGHLRHLWQGRSTSYIGDKLIPPLTGILIKPSCKPRSGIGFMSFSPIIWRQLLDLRPLVQGTRIDSGAMTTHQFHHRINGTGGLGIHTCIFSMTKTPDRCPEI